MGQIFLHTDGNLDAEYTTKHGMVLALPAAPVHQQLHVFRDAVQQKTSDTCNVVVAAFGLVHSDGAHWANRNENTRHFYYGSKQPTLDRALAAKQARQNPLSPYEQNYFGPMVAARKEKLRASGEITGARVWSYSVLPVAFCSGSRDTHHTPATVDVGQTSIQVVHKEDIPECDYESLAERFNAAGGRFGSGHNAQRDRHSEFHLAIWIHEYFEQILGDLPTAVPIPAGAKIYAITVDFVSTNAICATCARKLDALLTPGYLESLAEHYFRLGYITSARANPEGGKSGLRLVIRASASQAYAGAPKPAFAGAAPIQVKECYFNGSVTIHETNVIPV
jgi:hypothetical protein